MKYFIDKESERCYPLDRAIDMALEINPTAEEIELYKANRITGSDYFYCQHYGEIGEKGNCGQVCPGYESKTGNYGICKHNSYTYEIGERVYIKFYNELAHPQTEWRDIRGYEGKYQVSSCGLVKRMAYRNKQNLWVRSNLRKRNTNTAGYYQVTLRFRGKNKYPLVHRLVHQAFNGPLKRNMDIDHINCVRKDNRAINLRQVTRRENLSNRSDERASQYVGVSKNPRKPGSWVAHITIKNKQYYLGGYSTEEKASEAYQKRLSTLQIE